MGSRTFPSDHNERGLARRMGGAKRYPSISAPDVMGFATDQPILRATRTPSPPPPKTHAKKKQELRSSPSPLAAGRTVGATETCESTAGSSDRRRRRDPDCDLHADQPHLSCDPQADRVVL